MTLFHQKRNSHGITYARSRMSDRHSYSEGVRCASGDDLMIYAMPRSGDGSLHLIDDLLGDTTRLNRCLEEVDHHLAADVSARLSVQIREVREQVDTATASDTRYYNLLKIVIKTRDFGAVVDERPIPQGGVDSISDALDRAAKTFAAKVRGLRDSMPGPVVNECGEICLTPKAAGHFFHETIGHLVEADTFQFIGHRVVDQVIDPNITYYDDIRGTESLIGLSRIDDEGTEIQPAEFVVNGQLKDIIRTGRHNPSASELRGFARSQSFFYPPLPRMRMCVLKPPGRTDPIPERKRTFVVDSVYGGSVVPDRLLFIIRASGYLVINGEPTLYFPNMTVSGDLFASLRFVPYIGHDSMTFVSDCMKNGQIARVGHTAPTVVLDGQTIQGDSLALPQGVGPDEWW